MSTVEKFKRVLADWEKVELINLDYDTFDIKKMRKILNSIKYFRNQDYRNNELKDIDIVMGNLNDFLTFTMGWIHCNPSKKDTIKLSNEAFLLTKGDRSYTKDLNTEIGIKTFLNYLTSKNNNKEIVNIVGRKGEGKTYTQNYFLNSYTKDLINAGYTWFRVDLTQILKYQKRYGEWMSIKRYLYTQITYVYFRYSRSNMGTDKILSEITVEKLLFDIELHNNKLFFQKGFLKLFDKIKINCIERYKGKDGLNKPFEKENEKVIDAIAKSIIRLIKKRGYSYILFIDGFDNVDYIYDDNQDKWIDQIYTSFDDKESIGREFQPSSYVLTCRQETLIYIEQHLRKKPHGEWANAKSEQFTLTMLSHKDIFNKFLPTIIDKDLDNEFPEIVKKMKEIGLDKKLLEGTDKSLIKDFYDFGLKFDEYVSIAITERHGKEFILESKDILEVVYNGSLRDVLSDIKHVYMYIHYFLKVKSSKEKRKKQTVTEYIDSNIKKRCYLILSALPRNGNIYFNDINIFEPPYMLLHSLNLFSTIDFRRYSQSESKDILLSVVILNLLNDKGTKFQKDILEYCTEQGFDTNDITKDIEKKLLEHGLIELSIDGAEGENYKKLPRTITERGRYSLTVIKDMNVLHSFAYTMYFPQIFIESGIVKAHKNDLSDYSSAQVTNVMSMLKLFKIYQEDVENKIFDIFNDNIKQQLISFVSSMRESEVKEIIDKFQEFMDNYGDLEKVRCDFTRSKLIEMLKEGEISDEEFIRNIKQYF